MNQQTKIGFFEVADWEEDYIKNKFEGAQLFAEELNFDNLKKATELEIISVFIYSKLDREVIAGLPKLKFLASRSTGVEHIDLAACKNQGIQVSNVPFYGENTVAEHTFALILALSRNVHKAYVRTVRGDFSLAGLQGFDLKGKTLGAIGAGHIGLHVIKMARGFGMNVLAYDTYHNPFLEEVLGFKYVTLEELLKNSDIISLHAPYSSKTHHLINKDNIKTIKPGALLINTSRGGLVDTHALVEALDGGILGGAGLDVLEGEELIKEERQVLSKHFPEEKLETLLKNHILLHRDNVVITPHIAFYSKEALLRILDTTFSNIASFLSGNPQNIVSGTA